jgi:hypothetical protein
MQDAGGEHRVEATAGKRETAAVRADEGPVALAPGLASDAEHLGGHVEADDQSVLADLIKKRLERASGARAEIEDAPPRGGASSAAARA